MHVAKHPRVRVLPAKRNNRLAKNFQEGIEVASLRRKSGVEPVANLACGSVTIHRPIAKTAKIFDYELRDGVSPIAYLIGRRLEHASGITPAKNRVRKLRHQGVMYRRMGQVCPMYYFFFRSFTATI